MQTQENAVSTAETTTVILTEFDAKREFRLDVQPFTVAQAKELGFIVPVSGRSLVIEKLTCQCS